jgi:hypothetical protein
VQQDQHHQGDREDDVNDREDLQHRGVRIADAICD